MNRSMISNMDTAELWKEFWVVKTGISRCNARLSSPTMYPEEYLEEIRTIRNELQEDGEFIIMVLDVRTADFFKYCDQVIREILGPKGGEDGR